MSVSSGWGRLTWDQANWNEAVTLKTGWGAQAWNDGEWGELKDVTIFPTGLSGVGFSTQATDVQYLTSTVNFKYTLYDFAEPGKKSTLTQS